MGLFNNIDFHYTCPKCSFALHCFQTKDNQHHALSMETVLPNSVNEFHSICEVCGLYISIQHQKANSYDVFISQPGQNDKPSIHETILIPGSNMLYINPAVTVTFVDYNKAAALIEKKLGIKSNIGRFLSLNFDDKDYWGFLVEQELLGYDGIIVIDSSLLEHGSKWHKKITQAFIDEFGDYIEYWVSD